MHCNNAYGVLLAECRLLTFPDCLLYNLGVQLTPVPLYFKKTIVLTRTTSRHNALQIRTSAISKSCESNSKSFKSERPKMDASTLRRSFKVYLQERYPNDKNVSSTVSMAFFLDRYGDECGIDFHKVLADGFIPDSYRQQLKECFSAKGRKNPSGNAFVYERALRLLLEYIKDQPISPDTPPEDTSILRPQKKIASSVDIPTPTKQAVWDYLENWEQLPAYPEQENALHLLFRLTFPNNTNISEVLLKCSTLNDFYGTNIFCIFPVAKHIINLDIDTRLRDGDPLLVNDIAVGHGIINSKSGKEIQIFSFASKYCSHHNPADYPIYDSYVMKLLVYFRSKNKDGFAEFTNKELRDYPTFKKAILDFRNVYSLQDFDFKQIDQYLWQLGREKRPKSY